MGGGFQMGDGSQMGEGSWVDGDYFGFPVVALPRGEPASEFEVGVAEAFFERTADFDHVICNAPNYAAGPLREDAVVVCHGVWWDHDLWQHLTFRTPEWYALLERVFARPARVVSVDVNSVNVVRALFPDAARRMTHVPNLVDTDQFRPPPAPRADPVPTVLFPRRADIIRGPQLVGPILDLVPDPCRVQWVGDGPLLDELHAVAARDPRLRVATAPFDEMPAIYQGADICVIPTIGSEGQSLACLEAIASGCAVVATRVGGLPELIDDGIDGLLCDPTAESIAAALSRLLRDPALVRRLGAAARARAERFALTEWRARWADLLVDLGWIDDPTPAVPYDIVCFSIIDWEFRWQRPQQMMDRWAQRGRRVFVVRLTDHLPLGGEPFTATPLGENLWEVRLALPEGVDPLTGAQPEGATAAGLAGLEALARQFAIERAVSVVEVAGWHPTASATRDSLGWPVVYDCMDDWATFPGFAEQPHFLAVERDLVQTADLVVVSSGTILDRWIGERPDLLLARNAADFAFFSQAPDGPDALGDVPGPIAGFFGAVVEWFDQDLVRHAATACPDITFVFAGDVRRVSVDDLAALPNVRFLGPQPYETMPALLRRFDVALVPFEVSPVTDGMDVVKLYEYLSQGKPVVTTPIREIVPYADLLHVAATPDEFVAGLRRALAEDDPPLVARRIELARQHSWDERLDRIEARIRPHLAPRVGPTVPVAGDHVQALESELARWRDATDHLNRELEAVHRSRAWKAANLAWRARTLAEGAVKQVRRPTK
jgi:glycosyltransferase involved in cell wall biosynthesis